MSVVTRKFLTIQDPYKGVVTHGMLRSSAKLILKVLKVLKGLNSPVSLDSTRPDHRKIEFLHFEIELLGIQIKFFDF